MPLPAGVSVPADNTAPEGTPPMVMDKVSESSVTADEISKAMAVSSVPEAVPTD